MIYRKKAVMYNLYLLAFKAIGCEGLIVNVVDAVECIKGGHITSPRVSLLFVVITKVTTVH